MNAIALIRPHNRAARLAVVLALLMLMGTVAITTIGANVVDAQTAAFASEPDPVPTAEDLFGPAAVGDMLADALINTEMNSVVGTLRGRAASVNFDQLAPSAADYAADRAASADTFRLNLFADVGFDVVNTGLWDRSLNEPGYIWVGRVAGMEIGDVVLVITPDAIEGRVYVPGRIYSISLSGSVHVVTEIDPEVAISMAAQPLLNQINSANTIQGLTRPQADAAPQTGDPAMAGDPAVAGDDDGSLIDVMVVYTNSALQGGTTGQFLTALDTEFAAVNLGYQNSGVIQRVRLVHAVETSYVESSTSLTPDLNAVTGTADGQMDNVHALRDQYGADLVALVRGYVAGGNCGLAWLMGPGSVGNPASFDQNGFSVTARQCFSNYSFAHEMGHNMGSQHDILNAGSSPAFSYAYGYQDPGFFRTIMAYACSGTTCNRVPRWSNPNLTFNGRSTGTATANNALSLNNTRVTVANFRESIPSITATVSFTSPSSSVGEATSTHNIQARLTVSGGTVASPITVNLVYGGTATRDADYTAPNSITFTNAGGFAPGTYNQNVTLTIVNDFADEPNETVTVTLGSMAGATPTHTATIIDDDAALLVTAPTGTITTPLGNPTYSWSHVGAPTYELAVWKADYTQMIFWYTNLSAATYCSGGTCTVQPVDLPPADGAAGDVVAIGDEAARLPANGSYHSWVRFAGGAWQGPFPFTLNAPAPTPPTMGAVNNTNTLRPTGNFTLTGAAQNATRFWVFVNQKELHDAANYATPAVNAIYTRAQLCGSMTGTTCAFTPSVNLLDNTNYYLWILATGPGGDAVGGISGWVSSTFRVDTLPDPGLPVLDPVDIGLGIPKFTFTTDANTTQHSIYIWSYTLNTWTILNRVYTKGVTPGMSCNLGKCEIFDGTLILPNGAYSFWVNGIGPGGVSTGGFWGNGYAGPDDFTAGGDTGDFTFAFTAPNVIADADMNASIMSGSLVANWAQQPHAAWFNVWIGTYGAANTYYYVQHSSIALGCPALPGTCGISIPLGPLGIPPGTPIYFAVQTVGTGGALTTGGTYNNGFVVPGPFPAP